MNAYTVEESESIFNKIVVEMISGKSLKSILREENMPSINTFYKWIEEDEIKMNQYQSSLKSKKYTDEVKCKANPKGSIAYSLTDYRRKNARNTNLKRYPDSKIYIFKTSALNYYKIGVSQNIERRLKDVNCSSPLLVVLFYSKKIPLAYDLEIIIHSYLKEFHLRNEWFEVSNYKVMEEILNKIELWQGQ